MFSASASDPERFAERTTSGAGVEPSSGEHEGNPSHENRREWRGLWGATKRVEPADKPGSVVDSHSSGTTVTDRL